MKRLFLTITALLMFVATMSAGGNLTLPDITSGKFAAKTVNGINPIEGTDTYARISQDGERVVCCSFKTGKELSVLFDVKNTMGCKIDGFDDYVLSPDGKRMLIQTRRSASIAARSRPTSTFII